MGKCYKCGAEVKLRKGECRCSRCKTLVGYNCYSCKQYFEVKDKETKKQLKECLACKSYYCPNCEECSPNCPKNIWEREIKKILQDENPDATISSEAMSKIIDYIIEVRLVKKQRNCINNVPMSYARGGANNPSGHIKKLLARMQGFRVRDKKEQEIFERKLEEIKKMERGEKTTVEQLRDDGTYGQETRDALNLSVCAGLTKSYHIEKEDGSTYDLWERIGSQPCPYYDNKNIIVMKCPRKGKNCKEFYDDGVTQCPVCKWTKNSKNHKAGDPVMLRRTLSNNPTCNLSPSMFKVVGTPNEQE